MADSAEESFVARRTESVDAEGISKLIRRSTEEIFGRINVDHLIEHSNFSVSLVSGSGSGQVLGLLSLLDYPSPNSCTVDQASWEDWLHTCFDCPKASPVNCLFLHLFVAKDGYHQSAIAELLRTSFISLPLLHYIFLSSSPDAQLGPVLSAHFSPVTSLLSGVEETRLWATQRHQHFPVVHIRSAVVEDADDLMPIFQHCSATDVHQQYGEYFLAEMIESQDEHHQTLVAEVSGRAVGFMSVSSEVDIDYLNECYQLESFHGLKHPEDSDEVQTISTDGTITVSSVTLVSSSGKSFAPPTEEQGSTEGSSCYGDQLVEGEGPVIERGSIADMIEPKLTQSQPKIVQSGLLTSVSRANTEKEGSITEAGHTPPQEDPALTAAEGEGNPLASSSDHNPERSEIPAQHHQGDQKEEGKKQRKRKYVLKGGASALAVQLFGIDDAFEMRSIDFLPVVFQLFPEHDYLVLTQPPSIPDFPLLQMFTNVPPRVSATVSHQLYVLHKCALLHCFRVSPVLAGDIAGVAGLVSGLEGADSILSDVTQYTLAKRDPANEGGTPISAVVAKCSGQVVGVAVVRTEQEIGYIRSHYAIEDYVYFNHHCPSEHAHLNHFILNPVFAPYAKHMLKELLRLSSKSCLYYPIHRLLGPDTHHTLATSLSSLVPVLPRRQLVYPTADLGINKPLSEVTEVKLPHALYHTNRKLTLEPKLSVSARVVVVGGSDTALSLLKHLIFNPHLNFLNVVLVSPHGMPKAPPTSLTQSCCYDAEKLSLLGLPTWVSVVRGKLTALDRNDQSITVEGSDGDQVAVLHYDYLVLTTGLQYQLPQLAHTTPTHVFTVNDGYQELHLLRWVRDNLLTREEGDLVVYGGGLDAYCMLRTVLDEGLPAERLKLVVPRGSRPAFSNQEVTDSMSSRIEELGVKVISGVELTGFEVDGGEHLSALQLNEVESLPCAALVWLHDKQVDRKLFEAVNDAYLVFDNRLVISTTHSTNDPHIFAAGPLTKFSRKYRAGEWTHCQFDSSEVGEKLALMLLTKLDPTMEGCDVSGDSDLLPRYSKPKVLCAALPGDAHYLLVHKPRLDHQAHLQNEHWNMVTRSERGYFRLCVNQYGYIGEVEVLSQGPLTHLPNYLCLYNVHEKYLNNLSQRFNDKLIADFFELASEEYCFGHTDVSVRYFEEPWSCAVFHDRFSDFVDEVREHLGHLPAKSESSETIENHVRALVEEDPLSPLTIHRPALQAQFDNSPVKNLICQRLFKYLHYNSQHLTMYASPEMM